MENAAVGVDIRAPIHPFETNDSELRKLEHPALKATKKTMCRKKRSSATLPMSAASLESNP
jgi:hypothetical protein